MSKIKRYTCGNGEGMFQDTNGHYVEWSEYQKLNSELQRLLQQYNFSGSVCRCEMPAKVKGKNECWRCKKPFKELLQTDR